jgi:hypothetical protein
VTPLPERPEDAAAFVERCCDEAGMTGPASQPLRQGMVMTVRAALDARQAAEKVGREAGRQAAQAAGLEARSQFAKLAREVSWVKHAAVAGLVVLTAAVTWFAARQVPMATPYGRMTPAQAETLRFNDLGAAMNACAPQAPHGGRQWCSLGWWLSPPPPPVVK